MASITDIIASLPNYKKWKSWQDADVGIWDYLNYRADYELALAFGTLYWPEFVEIRGCVLLKEQYDKDNFDQWLNEFDGDIVRTEAMINHVHVYDLFLNVDSAPIDESAFEELGQVLKKTWHFALKEKFPTKQFDVIYSSEPEDYGPTISFHQVR